jgi:AcrR family transcriptional regulator
MSALYRGITMAQAKTRQRNARGEGSRLRLEIIEAAIRVIDADTDRLTLTSVAGETGIAGPSIYDHFSGVDDIRFEVIRSCYEDLIDQVRQAQRDLQDPVARLEATCLAYVGYAARFPHRYSLLFRAQRDREEKSAVGDRGAAALQTLVDGIADCKAVGVSGSVDPYDDALAIWSAIHGLAMLRASRPNFAQLHDNELMRRMIHRIALIIPPA